MLLLARRVSVGLACTIPLVLAPAVSLPAAAATPSGVAASARTTEPSAVPGAASSAKPPLRWSQYTAQRPRWSTALCADDARAQAAQLSTKANPIAIECARIAAPLDWSDLRKGSLTLNVTRLRHISPKGAGSAAAPVRGLFVNPGGPGGPAGTMVPTLGALKPALRTTHDVVGVDPRGTGLSTPLPCPIPQDVAPDYRNTTATVRAKVQDSYRAWVRTCARKHATVLPHITTVNTVHDQDLVRRLMGYPKLDWFGISGGSWMGAWYAQLHPRQAGRIVLDSNVDFTTDWRTSFADFPMGFQRRFERQFLPWVARQHRTYGLGTTTRATKAAYEYVRTEAGKGRVIGLTPNAVDAMIMLSLYDDAGLRPLAEALSSMHHDLRSTKGRIAVPEAAEKLTAQDAPGVGAVKAAAAPEQSEGPVVRTAILCQDTPFVRTRASFEREILATGKKNPLFGYQFGAILAPCAYWPSSPTSAPRIDGKGVPPILMVQNQLDPATPIEGARKAHAANRATRLVVAEGQGSHGAFFGTVTNRCIDGAVLGFLQRGSLPAQDRTCAGMPLPGEKRVYEVQTG